MVTMEQSYARCVRIEFDTEQSKFKVIGEEDEPFDSKTVKVFTFDCENFPDSGNSTIEHQDNQLKFISFMVNYCQDLLKGEIEILSCNIISDKASATIFVHQNLNEQ